MPFRAPSLGGRCGSLHFHPNGLAPSTPCRSPGALHKISLLEVSLFARVIGVASENGPYRTLGLTQRPESAFAASRGVAPLVVAGKVDLLPAEQRQVLQERGGQRMPLFRLER